VKKLFEQSPLSLSAFLLSWFQGYWFVFRFFGLFGTFIWCSGQGQVLGTVEIVGMYSFLVLPTLGEVPLLETRTAEADFA
jgi:hypothetical protein